jgi:hypothetical protein
MIPASDTRQQQPTALPSSDISTSIEHNQQNKNTLSMTHAGATIYPRRLAMLATNNIKTAVMSTSPTIRAQIYHNTLAWLPEE